MYFDQQPCHVRLEWGRAGLEALCAVSDVFVIVDVLSFSTCVDVATARGARVLPFPWESADPEAYARERAARLAQRARSRDALTLSPASLCSIAHGTRLVLPSPNGSQLSFAAAAHGEVLCGSLRNASAVARHVNAIGRPVAVIAAGERWPDGSVRTALEDALGAGALVSALRGSRSPEADAAEAQFARARPALAAVLAGCSSGRELIERGFPDDVEIAAQHDVSRAIPLLRDGEYRDASQPRAS